jgi:hypothetical protein
MPRLRAWLTRTLTLTPLLTAAGCSTAPSLADDEIEAQVWPGIAHAKPGMWIRWRCDRGEGTAVTEVMRACVAAGPEGIVVEERDARADGTTVTAFRYGADGSLRAAWRGPSGGAGVPLRLVPPVDWRAEATREVAARGGSLDDAEARAVQTGAEEVVDTPAGRLACRVQRIETSALFVNCTITAWHAKEPLPLSQLVRHEMGDSFSGTYSRQLLTDYGWTGAVPSLAPPAAR